MAYKSYGQYKESLADLNEMLAIEPTHQSAKKEYSEVKALFEQELTKEFEKKQKAAAKKATLKSNLEPTLKVSEVKEAKPLIEEVKDGKTSSPQKAPEPKKRTKLTDESIEKAAKIAREEIGKDTVRIPNTSYGFEADINSLKKDPENLYSYISKIPPSTYLKIYKNMDIQADYLVLILDSINKFETDNDRILNILYYFAQTQNITMTMMFMNDEDKKIIEQLIDKANQSTLPNKDKMVKKAKSMIE